MDNMQDTISNILSDPDAMDKIMELGKSLGLSGNSGAGENHSPAKEQGDNQQKPDFDIGSIAGMLSGMGNDKNSSRTSLPDPNTLGTIAKFMPILSGMNQEDDATALLYALRPFLSQGKQKKLDDASKMLKIMRVLPMIRSAGLF